MSSEIPELEQFLAAVMEETNKPLTKTERALIRGVLEENTYATIAAQLNLSRDYIACSLSSKLFQRISHVLNVRVNRRNFTREIAKAYRGYCERKENERSEVVTIELLDLPDPTILSDILHILSQQAGLHWRINHLKS